MICASVGEQVSPGGGGAFSSVSANGTTIYVTSDLGGLYKSTNAGVSWSPVTIKGTPITSCHVSMVWVDPTNASHVFVGDDAHGLIVSSNGGDSWSQVADVCTTCYPTALCKLGSGRLLLATQPGWNVAGPTTFYRSINNGLNWAPYGSISGTVYITKLVPIGSALYTTSAIAISGGNAEAGNVTARAYFTADEGANWHTPNFNPPTGNADSIRVVSVASGPSTSYMTVCDSATVQKYNTDGRVFASADGGANWTGPITITALKGACVNIVGSGLTVLTNLDGNSGGKTWRSTTAGGTTFTQEDTLQASWTYGWEAKGPTNTIPDFGRRYARCRYGASRTVTWLGGATLFWTSSFASLSNDAGSTFQPLDTDFQSGSGWKTRGINNTVPQVIFKRAGRLYGGWNDLGFFYSDDDGDHWNSVNDSLDTGNSWLGRGGETITGMTGANGVIWWTNGSGNQSVDLFHATDVTGTHTKATGLPQGFISDLTQDNAYNGTFGQPSHVYVSDNGRVYKSTDDHSFTLLTGAGTGKRAVAAHLGVVFAGGDSGFVYSSDGGQNWSNPVATTKLPASAPCTSDCYKELWKGVHDIFVDYPKVYVTVYDSTTATNRGLHIASYPNLTQNNDWTNLISDKHARRIWRDANANLAYTSGRRFMSGGVYDGLGFECYHSSWTQYNDYFPFNNVTALFNDDVNAKTYVGVLGQGFYRMPFPCAGSGGGGGGCITCLGPGTRAIPDSVGDGQDARIEGSALDAFAKPVVALTRIHGVKVPGLCYDLQGRRIDRITSRGVYFLRAAKASRPRVLVVR